MAIVLGDRPARPLTVDEVMRMLEAGIIDESERVELLHGVLWEKAVKSPQHGELKRRLVRWLGESEAWTVHVEDPLVLPDGISLPEPDIAVVPEGDYLDAHPTSALLIIEVALTSLKIDLTVKPSLYALLGVEAWVVDVAAQHVHVFREPGPEGYARETVFGPVGMLAPLAVDVEPLDLAALFDGL
jgi:Uma2 family endonuclease